jgi:hypothetical protein
MRLVFSVALVLAATAVGLIVAAAPVEAHHAFAAEFDQAKPVKLAGRVVKMEWINPHAWIHIAVPDANGKETIWMVEGGSPNIMLRRGFSKQSLVEGTELTVEGYRAKNGENKANGGSITFKDGKRLFVGGSNPDDKSGK